MADPMETPGVVPDEVDAAPAQGRADTGEVWWTAPDGTAFASQDDLAKQWSSMLPKSEYTKKTQALAEERRLFDQDRQRHDLDRQEHQRKQDELQKRQKEFETFDRFVKERPATYKRWMQEIQQGPGADDMTGRLESLFDERYGSQLKELADWKAQREAQEAEKTAFDELASQWEDFDGDAVRSGITELTAKLQGGDFKYLAEVMYLANVARQGTPSGKIPAPEPEPTPRLMPGSGAPPKATGKAPASIEEAGAMARRELG